IGIGGNGSISTPGNALNDALQAAIWQLQGQSLNNITFSGPLNTADVTMFINDAIAAATLAGTTDTSDAAGAFGVYALNMYSGSPSRSLDQSYVQPELVQIPTPVPETSTVFAGALLLVPLGVSALRRMTAVKQS
ncbi:MAG TPA: hypothetical protein VMH87_19680, partial [Pseudomonadales bacterium]|nr:hypothetical protein [Pseudomonadales bacterium]